MNDPQTDTRPHEAVTPEKLTLASLREGETAEVALIDLEGSHGRRLHQLGFVSGTKVRVVRKAPLGDPREYEVRGTRFCLRRVDASRILTRRVSG